MNNLTDIPNEEFPLNYAEYCEIRNKIVSAAWGFSNLGTAVGKQIDRELMEVHEKLGHVWETIRNEERREIERKADGVSICAR